MFKTIKDLKIKKIKLNNLLNYNNFYEMRANCNNDKKCFFCNDNFYNSEYLFYTNEIIKDHKYFYEFIHYQNTDGYNFCDYIEDSCRIHMPAISLAQYTLIKDKNNVARKVFLFDKNDFNQPQLKNILYIFYITRYNKIEDLELFFKHDLKEYFEDDNDFKEYFKNENMGLKILDKVLSNNSYCFFYFNDCFYDINEDFEDPKKFKNTLREAIFNLIGKEKNIDFFNKEQLPFNLDFHLMCQ